MADDKKQTESKGRQPRTKQSSLDQLRDAQRQQAIAETRLAELKAENQLVETAKERLLLAEQERDEALAVAQDFNHRTYTFTDTVEESSVVRAMKTIAAWARISPEPIVLRYNSPGGNVYDGFAMYDHLRAIDATRAPITTVVVGYSASMAGILVQAGRRRIMAPNAQFMVHEVADWSFFKVTKATDAEDEAKLLRDLNNRLFGVLVDGSKRAYAAGTSKVELTLEDINERAKRRDWWLSADQALDVGLVDEVGYV